MSSLSRLSVPALRTIEKEQDLREKQILKLTQDIDACNHLVTSPQSLSRETKQNSKIPSQNEEESDDSSMDPLKELGLDEIMKIMTYLKGIELLKAMEVSHSWKSIIEGQSLLINRAMDEVVMKAKFENCKPATLKQIFNENREKRPFKHLKAFHYSQISLKLEAFFDPVAAYASSLESLEIEDEFEPPSKMFKELGSSWKLFNGSGCEFPRLKKLKYKGKFLHKLAVSSFPAVTHLQLKTGVKTLIGSIPVKSDAFRKTLSKFPQLKYLQVLYLSCIFEADGPLMPIEMPKVEQLSLSKFEEFFIKDLRFLQVLEIQRVTWDEIDTIFRDLKELKRLTISFGFTRINDDDPVRENFEESNSIESFGISAILIHYEDYAAFIRQLEHVLRAIPSLKEFALNYAINEDIIGFIASNMINLKKFICKDLSMDADEKYREVKRNSHRYQNSDFELVVQRSYDFWKIGKNFV